MFSGIVEEQARILVAKGGQLTVESKLDHQFTTVGDSVCINGVCLTVVKVLRGELSFDLAPETVRCSNLGELKVGDRVNLERSLKVGDRISGHFVFGHVDAVLTVVERREDGNSIEIWFVLPEEFRRYVVPKGSVTLSGVSLTVGAVKPDRFCVWLVPHTSSVTSLGVLGIGDRANFEVDMLARYATSRLS